MADFMLTNNHHTREIEIARSVLLEDPPDTVRRGAASRSAAASSVDDAFGALGLVAVAQAAEVSLAAYV